VAPSELGEAEAEGLALLPGEGEAPVAGDVTLGVAVWWITPVWTSTPKVPATAVMRAATPAIVDAEPSPPSVGCRPRAGAGRRAWFDGGRELMDASWAGHERPFQAISPVAFTANVTIN
jgi:hypothetical protein